MYLIATSFHIEKSIADEAVEIIRNELAKAMSDSGIFNNIFFGSILVDVDPSLKSFTLQAAADNLDEALGWLQEGDGVQHQVNLRRKFGERVVWFTTPMQRL